MRFTIWDFLMVPLTLAVMVLVYVGIPVGIVTLFLWFLSHR